MSDSPHGWTRAPIWLGIGLITMLSGVGMFAFDVDHPTSTTQVADAKPSEQDPITTEIVEEARRVGVARVLSVYGPLDSAELAEIDLSHENLDERFAQAMAADPIDPAAERAREVEASSIIDEVIGNIDKKAVTATVRRRMPGLGACYAKALRSNPELQGKMVYAITIDPSGRVTNVKSQADTVGVSSVQSCVEAKIRSWRFFTEGANTRAEVTFTVTFTSVERREP